MPKIALIGLVATLFCGCIHDCGCSHCDGEDAHVVPESVIDLKDDNGPIVSPDHIQDKEQDDKAPPKPDYVPWWIACMSATQP